MREVWRRLLANVPFSHSKFGYRTEIAAYGGCALYPPYRIGLFLSMQWRRKTTVERAGKGGYRDVGESGRDDWRSQPWLLVGLGNAVERSSWSGSMMMRRAMEPHPTLNFSAHDLNPSSCPVQSTVHYGGKLPRGEST